VPAAPFGSWPSPITADVLVEQTVRLGDIEVDGADVFWVEGRPSEGGRQAVVRWSPSPGADEGAADITPDDFSARSLVHEYGGRCVAVHGGVVYASNFADQRVWRLAPGEAPAPITPEPPAPNPTAWRYADPVISPDGGRLFCVRETHNPGGEPRNELVVVDTAGGAEPCVLASGPDFVAAPRLSPDGRRLAWLAWHHPNMPWDGTELWVADPDGADARLVAGGPDESVSQPRWRPDGVLHYVSDRTGWWNLYAEDGTALAPMAAEFSAPDWLLGQSTYTFLDDGGLVAAWQTDDGMHLGILDGRAFHEIAQPFTAFASLQPHGDGVVCLAGSPTAATAVVRIAVPDGAVEVLARSRSIGLDPAVVSVPRPITFPTTHGDTARALFYPPANGDWTGLPDERPPLVVTSHGGPTTRASSVLNTGVQWWTSRGIAVVDVDYRGSSGYGRRYRRRLNGNWGLFDADDCVHAARWLAEQGEVDSRRVVIRGESASGFTTLCALVFHDAFAAGASYYGIGDLEALARDTHKFESRYIDRLIGPYPEAADVYRARSPVHHAERLSTPVILLQGLEDKVVPPQQAEALAQALRQARVPFASLAFAGEQHGFRQAATITSAAEAELSFYGQVLGFTPAGDIPEVAIERPV
jgi:dipeptidyl aminopeptidase/acylaminoacyl peptidase